MKTKNDIFEYDGVLILPFKRGEDSLPQSFGITYNTEIKQGPLLLQQELNDEYENSLECAIKELEVCTGYKVIDEYLWTYIGDIYLQAPIQGLSFSCYVVDITNVKSFPEYIQNAKIDLRFVELSELIKMNDVLILSVLMKFYINKFSKIFSIN